MESGKPNAFLIGSEDLILVTGAAGFMGPHLVRALVNRGFRNLRCFIRPSADASRVEALSALCPEGVRLEFVTGNLLVPADCAAAAKQAAVIYHLAAGRGEKSVPDAFLNSVVTTRNLLDATLQYSCLKRFVNVSSFAVYSNREKPHRSLLDETCPVEPEPALRGEAYCFAKVKQDEIVTDYRSRFGTPSVIVRPGYVYGPGNESITGRVGIDTFGVFLHFGGSNKIPATYVANCAEAIALAGLTPGVDGEVFNVVDDDLPTSRQWLRLYKRHVRRFRSFFVPGFVSYLFCSGWEWYSQYSAGQLPPAFNRRRWHAYWKKTAYTNSKLKTRLLWKPPVSTPEALQRYFAACREARHA